MASSNFKNPPGFDPKTMTYEAWKNEVEVWKLVTELKPEKQALAVSLSLKGNAKELAMEIKAEDLAKDTGMTTLLQQLDKVFLRDDKDKAYEAYKNFDTFRKTDSMSMSDYIVEFDKRYSKSKKHDMVLPEAVLAFKLLDNAELSTKDRQLALTASSDLKYISMKSALQRIFGDGACPGGARNETNAVIVKQEPVYFTQQRKSGSTFKQRGTNPLNKFGKRTKCAICQSVFHWAKDCPDRNNAVKFTECEAETVEDCNVTLFTKEQPSANEIFVMESSGSAVIDTACTRTVCGNKWFKKFAEEANEVIRTERSNKSFRFGDGKVVHSFSCATLPAKIGNTYCNIDTEIVEADIPLLLSKSSLKKAGTVLDLKNDRATMFNQPVDLEFTSSGHYCVNILRPDQAVNVGDEVLQVIDITHMSEDEKLKILVKLHKQFGHASYERLAKLLKSTGRIDSETLKTLQKVCEDCKICLVNKKPAPRPVVGLPLATEFNEMVAVDLHELEPNTWYLHIIDEFTRFSAGRIMRSKKSSEFVKKFLESWVAVHGAPKRLFSDNGGEFNNTEVHDMAENFSIEIKTTAAYSPWSNGLMERHNETLTEILHKVKADKHCDWETALYWALMAKNSLNNVHGYSSYQLVYGRNPNVPGVLTDKLPALEGTTFSDVVAKHIEALHSARTAFTQTECSERIRRALRKQVRPSGIQYKTGDKVYYKRNESKEWKGPGVVIGQDGPVIFVRHGGMLVRVHQCRLTKTLMEGNKFEQSKTTQDRAVDNKEMSNEYYESDEEQDETNDTGSTENSVSDVQASGSEGNNLPETDTKVNVTTGQIVKYRDIESTESCVATVVGRAGKATGNNRHWFNLRFLQPETMKGAEISVDLSKVSELEVLDQVEECKTEVSLKEQTNSNTEENVMILNDTSFKEAKLNELESWKKNGVYFEQEDSGQKCLSTRWICSLKDTPNGTIHKARLVARGFEEIEKDNIQKDSPTCGSDSLRVVLAVLAQKRWNPHSIDIKTAFLQGSDISREVFIKPPPEANAKGVIWKLRKCVYGLSDASLSWYKKVKEILEQCGVEVSRLDPAVFLWKNEQGTVEGVIACHVDDFLWGGSANFEKQTIGNIRSKLSVGREENGSFPYVGIEIAQLDQLITLRQMSYQENLQPITIDKDRLSGKEAPLNGKEKEQLQSKIGQILWIARQSRPDVIFEASNLASSLTRACVQTLVEANKIIRSIKSEKVTLKFNYLGQDENLRLLVFSDSSHGNLHDGGTQGGHFIALAGNNGIFSPLTWQSKRIRRTVRSTLAAETLAMTEAIDNAVFLASLYTELSLGKAAPSKLPIVCFTDCRSLWDALKSTKQVSEKRLRLEISSIRELLEQQQIKTVRWIETKSQLADCLTKRGASCLGLLKALENGAWLDVSS